MPQDFTCHPFHLYAPSNPIHSQRTLQRLRRGHRACRGRSFNQPEGLCYSLAPNINLTHPGPLEGFPRRIFAQVCAGLLKKPIFRCRHRSSSIVINGVFPAPLIKANKVCCGHYSCISAELHTLSSSGRPLPTERD
jgi:hypothetical protein